GGTAEAYASVGPIFEAIAAQVGGEPCCTHIGSDGSGHFVKMVHNGIEYGIMAAIAEGLNLLENADAGVREAEHSAEVAPLEEPEFYQFDIDTAKVAELWRRGSVISSWLLDLTAGALASDQGLERFSTEVADSGEGRWTIDAAMEEAVPAHVLSAALYTRFRSRDADMFPERMLSA
ncbi:MAG: 6-phosphogluconate dehydrogenase (decarboxylating), partial [Gammaproteobacteria bacterium]